MYSPRRILVAGSTGVIARRVVAALAAGGDTVFGLARSERSAGVIRALGATAIPADPVNRTQLFAALRKVRPDIVIHHATALPTTPLTPPRLEAATEPRSSLLREVNCNLAAAAEEYGVQRLVAQSIAFAYRPDGPQVADESAELDTGAPGPWGEIVSAAADVEETALAGRNYVGVVLRFGALYGPETETWVNGHIAELVRRRRLPIVGGGRGRQSFIHIDDAASATLAALDQGSGVYNVVDDNPVPSQEWIPVLARALGAPPPRRIPVWLARPLAGEHTVRVLTGAGGATNARIRGELGWKPEYPDVRATFGQLRAIDGARG